MTTRLRCSKHRFSFVNIFRSISYLKTLRRETPLAIADFANRVSSNYAPALSEVPSKPVQHDIRFVGQAKNCAVSERNQVSSRGGNVSSREKAHRSLGQCLPLYPPFRVSWQSGHQALHHVSFSPSKIPYGGFSPVRLQAGRHQRQPSSLAGLICRPSCFSFHTQ